MRLLCYRTMKQFLSILKRALFCSLLFDLSSWTILLFFSHLFPIYEDNQHQMTRLASQVHTVLGTALKSCSCDFVRDHHNEVEVWAMFVCFFLTDETALAVPHAMIPTCSPDPSISTRLSSILWKLTLFWLSWVSKYMETRELLLVHSDGWADFHCLSERKIKRNTNEDEKKEEFQMNILLIFICILACIPLGKFLFEDQSYSSISVLTQYPAQFEPVPCKNECRSEGGDVGRCCHLYG